MDGKTTSRTGIMRVLHDVELYCTSHWNGEHSLWQSWWVNCGLIYIVGCNIVSVAMVLASTRFFGRSSQVPAVFIAGDGAVNLIVCIWAVRGLWQAAEKYQGPRWHANMAKVAVAFTFSLAMVHALFSLISMVATIGMRG